MSDEAILGKQEVKEKGEIEEGERFGSDDEEERCSRLAITMRACPPHS